MFRRFFSAAAICALAALATPAQAEGEVAFAYQGRVKVQGSPFSGTGQFKFSIVDTSGTATLWSNDGSASGGGEPSGFLPLQVTDGIFNVIVGDTSAGMQPINGIIFNSASPLKLRVWFNDGARGFQQLNPDHNLVNLTLNVLETGNQDFTIYVNGTTGSDRNNGLTPSTAKKTIQAAVDSLPDRVNCNITIDIADGTYHEEVSVHGISVSRTKSLTFLGDESWTPASGTPQVVISGATAGSPTVPARDYAFYGQQCSGLSFVGIHFTRAILDGLYLQNGSYTVSNCMASYNVKRGFINARQTEVNYTNCHSTYNDVSGFTIATASRSTLTSCSATYNGAYGVDAFHQSSCNIAELGDFSNNGRLVSGAGVRAGAFSDLAFNFPADTSSIRYKVRSNNGYGAQAGWHGYCIYTSQSVIDYAGNSNGATSSHTGGIIYP